MKRQISKGKLLFWRDFENNIVIYFNSLSKIYNIIENKIPCSLIKEISNMTNSKEKSYNILHQAFNKMYIDLKEKRKRRGKNRKGLGNNIVDQTKLLIDNIDT